MIVIECRLMHPEAKEIRADKRCKGPWYPGSHKKTKLLEEKSQKLIQSSSILAGSRGKENGSKD